MSRMWGRYQQAAREAEETWQEGDCPVEVAAVSRATGLDPDELWEAVEGKAGWESHDTGYQGMVWMIAWQLKGYPDWERVTPAPPAEAETADDRWRQAHGGDQGH